ncbi:hypothetical protein E3N88_06383 [Mikania micrantha]|uniref:Uncharacterized protein n=1 Tax=Mikania micrantha TaxID=192012 RepID=A0A5N6PQN9_9ASTR|nr:hypothetical protein E3N88_06383 [Mikania micrantha]
MLAAPCRDSQPSSTSSSPSRRSHPVDLNRPRHRCPVAAVFGRSESHSSVPLAITLESSPLPRLKLLQNKLIPKNDVTSEEIDAIENKNVDTKPFVASVEELEHGKNCLQKKYYHFQCLRQADAGLPDVRTIFNQNGAGSPDFFGNLMTKFTKNPEMMNKVNQLAQQMDGNQDLTSMLTSMGGSLNILIKLMAVESLVLAPFFATLGDLLFKIF